jgi:tetratricopeptide (TPR) repeat protein
MLAGAEVAHTTGVDISVIGAAVELYRARHYPGVVAACGDALDYEPGCVELRVLRAKALLRLRRDVEAQLDLREVIRLDPKCGLAYRLLGELAARRDEHESARIFLREALRLDPTDRETVDWLAVVDGMVRPTAAAEKLPAIAAAVGASNPARGSTPLISRELGAGPLGRRVASEGPDFGRYLIQIGLLTPDRLKAAQAYQRSMNVKLSTAVIALGLASQLKVEWASLAFHGGARAA